MTVKTYDYDAFGNDRNELAADANPFRYCGEYYDTATQTYFLRARWYDPSTGRFTQQDSWAYYKPDDPLSLNLYLYCSNNPIDYIDPEGFKQKSSRLGKGEPYFGGNTLCINGQSKNVSVKDVEYGRKTISYNGCELLAVYNAMILVGNEQPFVDIKNKAETTPRVMWFNGRLGSRPKELGRLLDGFEQNYNVITEKSKFNECLKDGGVYIISCWTSYRLLSSIHTVAFTCDAEMNIIVYNRYSNITTPYKYDAIAHKTGLDRFLDETGAPIVMYELVSEEVE